MDKYWCLELLNLSLGKFIPVASGMALLKVNAKHHHIASFFHPLPYQRMHKCNKLQECSTCELRYGFKFDLHFNCELSIEEEIGGTPTLEEETWIGVCCGETGQFYSGTLFTSEIIKKMVDMVNEPHKIKPLLRQNLCCEMEVLELNHDQTTSFQEDYNFFLEQVDQIDQFSSKRCQIKFKGQQVTQTMYFPSNEQNRLNRIQETYFLFQYQGFPDFSEQTIIFYTNFLRIIQPLVTPCDQASAPVKDWLKMQSSSHRYVCGGCKQQSQKTENINGPFFYLQPNVDGKRFMKEKKFIRKRILRISLALILVLTDPKTGKRRPRPRTTVNSTALSTIWHMRRMNEQGNTDSGDFSASYQSSSKLGLMSQMPFCVFCRANMAKKQPSIHYRVKRSQKKYQKQRFLMDGFSVSKKYKAFWGQLYFPAYLWYLFRYQILILIQIIYEVSNGDNPKYAISEKIDFEPSMPVIPLQNFNPSGFQNGRVI